MELGVEFFKVLESVGEVLVVQLAVEEVEATVVEGERDIDGCFALAVREYVGGHLQTRDTLDVRLSAEQEGQHPIQQFLLGQDVGVRVVQSIQVEKETGFPLVNQIV